MTSGYILLQVEGSWAVRSAVGQKPALIGKKITQTYIRRPENPNVFEIDIDISSSHMAVGILRMVRCMSLGSVSFVGFLSHFS
jgi:hypothetical protein